jgi:tetratricopeptide (TPR) repeat protein
MKDKFILIILFSFISCSSQRIDRKIEDASWDSLADETFLRWGDNRLVSKGSSHQVVNCYLGKTDETLKQFKKDYGSKNQSPYYWLHIGNCYFIKEDWSKAEFYYRMTLEDGKNSTLKSIALNNLGLIHFRYEQWEKGKNFLSESLKLTPKFKVPRYNLSQLYLQFGLYDKAITLLNDPLLKNHKDIDLYFSLANAYLFKGDLKNSHDYFAKIPKESFRREDIAATYALFLIKKGDLEGAKTVIKDRDRSGVIELTAISQKIEKIIAQRLKEE